MSTSEKTDSVLYEDITQTDSIESLSSGQMLSTPLLPGVEVNNLTRYILVLLVLVTCFLTLLWSRLDINETKVAMGKAQRNYRTALEENHRLQLELNLLLDPASIERQVEEWDLEKKGNAIDIYEVK